MIDGTLQVYARRGDIPRNQQGLRNVAAIGTALYGDRFNDITFSDYAVFEINNAIKTILWLRHLACRIEGEETPHVLQKFLDAVDLVDRTTESSKETLTGQLIRDAFKTAEDAPLRPDTYEDGPEIRKALGMELCEHCNKIHKNGLPYCSLYVNGIGIVPGEHTKVYRPANDDVDMVTLVSDGYVVPVTDDRLTRAEWEATIDKEAGQRDLERQFDARPQIVDFSVAFDAAVKGDNE